MWFIDNFNRISEQCHNFVFGNSAAELKQRPNSVASGGIVTLILPESPDGKKYVTKPFTKRKNSGGCIDDYTIVKHNGITRNQVATFENTKTIPDVNKDGFVFVAKPSSAN